MIWYNIISVINPVQNNSFCTVYIYYVYINTQSIYFENIYMYLCIYLFLYLYNSYYAAICLTYKLLYVKHIK